MVACMCKTHKFVISRFFFNRLACMYAHLDVSNDCKMKIDVE
jgi:hypothetical protein